MKFYMTLSTVPAAPEQPPVALHLHDPGEGCYDCPMHEMRESEPKCKAAAEVWYPAYHDERGAPASCPLRNGPVVVATQEHVE